MELVCLSFVLLQNFVINIHFTVLLSVFLFLFHFLHDKIPVDRKCLLRAFYPWQLGPYPTEECRRKLGNSSGWMSDRRVPPRRA